MRSVGVTQVMEATTPEAIPASMLRRGERVPVSGSLKEFLMVSKERKRIPSLPTEPITRGRQPLYLEKMVSMDEVYSLVKGLKSFHVPTLQEVALVLTFSGRFGHWLSSSDSA